MKYYVVTFTHTKIVGWAIYLHAHVKYLKKLLKEDPFVKKLGASYQVIQWDPKFGEFR